MANIEHASIADADRHEPKGASTAATGQTIISDGAGGTSFGNLDYSDLASAPVVPAQFAVQGWSNYTDTATSGTPITIPTPGTFVELTCDGLGAITDSTFAYPTGTETWNTSTNRFDFSNLNIGDTVDFRVALSIITTAANAVIDLEAEFGLGVTPFKIALDSSAYFKTSGTYTLVGNMTLFIGNDLIQNNPGRLIITCDITGTTVVVGGVFIRVIANVQ